MNWLLILVVLLVAGNIVWGFFRGFLRVVYSMAAWILILVFVTFATPYVAAWIPELKRIAKRNCKMPWQGKKKVQKNKTRKNRKISAVWE